MSIRFLYIKKGWLFYEIKKSDLNTKIFITSSKEISPFKIFFCQPLFLNKNLILSSNSFRVVSRGHNQKMPM